MHRSQRIENSQVSEPNQVEIDWFLAMREILLMPMQTSSTQAISVIGYAVKGILVNYKFVTAISALASVLYLTIAVPNASGAAPVAANRAAPAEAPTPSPANLYVSSNGDDSHAGTEDMPFRSIERAARAAAAGTTVRVAPGVYVGNITTRNAGKPGAAIRYLSTVKWGARLIGQGKEAAWTNHGDYTHISGFDISGSGRLGILNLGSHTLVEGNHVHHLAISGGCTPNGGAGIDNGNYASSDGDIIGNIVHDIGVPGACNGVHGIYSSNRGGHIVNNLVYRVSSYGIHLWHAATRVTIANNTLFANGSTSMGGGIVLGNGDGPGGAVLNDTWVVNNIVYDNPGASIIEFCYPGHECTGANNVFANNLVFNNGRPISLRRGRAKNTIAADPQFIDYRPDGSGNYQLGPGSPAIAKSLRLAAAAAAGSGNGSASKHARGGADLGADIARVPVTVPYKPVTSTLAKAKVNL